MTVTGVSGLPDLHDARVYVSVFGGEKRGRRALDALEAARGCCSSQAPGSSSIKRTPRLAFEYDPTVEHGVRMTKLIDELAPERATR